MGPKGRGVLVVVAVTCCAAALAAEEPLDAARLRLAALGGDWQAVEAMGPAALTELVRLYEKATVRERVRLAQVFYRLGWKSEEAKRVLLADVRSADSNLRRQVPYALGRVSDDPAVIDVLLDGMREGSVPLFVDQAGCALVYDQLRLAPAQKLRLLEGLVAGLENPKLQVRQVAIQALAILTHQTRGFAPGADETARSLAVAAWRLWLEEQRENL